MPGQQAPWVALSAATPQIIVDTLPETDLTILIPDFSGGGAERAALNLAGALSRRGRRVEILVFQDRGPLSGQCPDGVHVSVLGTRRALTSGRGIARYLDATRPRTLLSFMFHTNVAAAIGVLLARHRPRLVWSVQNAPKEALSKGGWPSSVVLRHAVKLGARVPDAIVAVSLAVERAFSETVPRARGKLVTVYNPVIDPARLPERLTRPPGSPPELIAVGRLAAQKNYPLMLEAFQRVRADPRAREARLTILGEGPLRAAIEAEAEKLGVASGLRMPGFVDAPAAWMARSDVFVMSSDFEGLANVIPEAMAVGLPVVTTDWPPAAREVLEDGRWGRLVPLGDPQALADAILATLADGGTDARARAKDFEIEPMADAYERVLFPATNTVPPTTECSSWRKIASKG
ncbi:MAG: glycosyltransferase [Pseudomonadota bacterium]